MNVMVVLDTNLIK